MGLKPSQETLDIIEKLKQDPTIEAVVGDCVYCTISFRGDEWVVTLEGERFTETAKDYDPTAIDCVELYCEGIRDIEYCENCGKETQLQCMRVCYCDDED